jgi:hypothetical protein
VSVLYICEFPFYLSNTNTILLTHILLCVTEFIWLHSVTTCFGSWSRSCRFNPGEGSPGTHWVGGWVVPRAGLDAVEKRKFLTLPGLELRSIGRLARSQLLCRLRYPGSCLHLVPRLITHCYIACRKYVLTTCCLIKHKDKFIFNLFTSLYQYYIRHCSLLEVQTIQYTAFLKQAVLSSPRESIT